MNQLTEIILSNENLIYSVINKYGKYYDFDDLYQVGVMGIIKAYNNYKSDMNTKFTSYAYSYIFGEIIKYINDNKCFKISKENRNLYKKINEAKTLLTQKLMKEPSNYELSLFLEVDEKLIDEVINMNQTIDSLDREIMEDGKKVFLYDMVGKEENTLDNMFLYEQLGKLSKEELILLKERYFLDKTQSEVARDFGINQVKVSRTEQKILKKLSDNYRSSSYVA